MLKTLTKLRLLAGGIILNMVQTIQVAGNLNNWGTLYPYIASYYYQSDSSLSTSDFSIVPFYGFVSESLFTVLISYLSSLMSLHHILLIFITLSCSLMFLTSFITNPYFFTLAFGFSLGSLAASIFLPSLWIVWSWIPENKPITSGILLTGYNFGPIPFSILFTLLANPDNYKAVKGNDGQDYMFDSNVALNTPMAVRVFSSCLLVSALFGLFLLPWKMNEVNKEDEGKEEMSILRLIKKSRFWKLFFMMLFSMVCQGYSHTMYKVIAIKFINEDFYSTYVGMAAFFVGGIGRGTFGYLICRFYWKKVMSLVYITQIIIMLGLWFIIRDKLLYGLFIVIYNFTIGSLYNNVLILTENDFPGSKKVISFVCLSFIVSFFVPYLLDKFITPVIGYFFTFVIIAGFSLALLIQTVDYREKLTRKRV